MGLPHWVLLAVAAQRLVELVYAHANTRKLLAAGAVEIGAAHYPLFILLHGGWLVALFALTPANAPVSWPLLAVYAALQLGRVWAVLSLGRYWTTRIITPNGAPALVRRGPYRWFKHPNYLVVALEIPILPLAFGQSGVAAAFCILNLALLWRRIRVENAALNARELGVSRL